LAGGGFFISLYRRKPTTVDAEQFIDAANPPRGVTLGHLSGMHEVVTLQGMTVGVRIGEWIVREAANADRFSSRL
jgi:hypothetical protein